MSGLDPLAALAAETAVTQSQIQAIDLGVAIEILQQQLSVGDLLTATVLPPQGGVDLLSLFNTQVVAQLPPGVNPGQSLLLQVTGFSGNQILVQNLGTVDPQNPLPTINVVLPQNAPANPPPAGAQQAVVTTILPGVAPGAPPPASATGTPPGAQAPVAPSRAVFVAGSVQQANPPQQANPSAPSTPAGAPASLPPAIAAAAGDVAQLGLEARIAATRAAAIDIAELVRIPGTPKAPGPVSAQLPPPIAARAQLPVPPPIAVSARPLVPPSPEAALLERLRLPFTPLLIGAAKIAADAGSLLPRALAKLETLLAGLTTQDSRVATLRTLLSFGGKLDPGNERALPEQLAAFVNNFVGGPESKLAAVIRAFAEAPEPPAAPSTAPGNAPTNAPNSANAGTAANTPAPGAQQQPAQAGVPLDPGVAARVAERAVALQYDAKAAVAALLETPPAGTTQALANALTQTLTAITGLQINVLDSPNANNNAIVIPLPVFYREDGAPVQLHVSRDAPGGRKLDADNFSIAFVLDTKTLGTVAIDVQTAGRAVSVNVKTEGAPAASRFRSTLDDLRGRLQQLRYTVANMSAGVAPHHIGAAPEPAAPATEVAPERTSSVLDTRA